MQDGSELARNGNLCSPSAARPWAPFVHDHWEEVYLFSGDLIVRNDAYRRGCGLPKIVHFHEARLLTLLGGEPSSSARGAASSRTQLKIASAMNHGFEPHNVGSAAFAGPVLAAMKARLRTRR
jgi:hypothetical protein